MRVRRMVATCLVGAMGASVLPGTAKAFAPPATAVDAVAGAPTALEISAAYMPASLRQLLNEVNARWPHRSRASDGWLGDARHRTMKSDHNPVGHPNGPGFGSTGAVHALDITSTGIDATGLVGALLGDSRVWYVIYNRTIWSRSYGWKARPYTGSPHTTHIHISLRGDSQAAAVQAERDSRPWLGRLAGSGPLTTEQVKQVQRALIARGFTIPSGPTGRYGAETTRAMAAFQRSQGWRGSGADGKPGPVSLARLGVSTAPSVTFASPAAAKVSSSGSYVPGARGAHIVALQKALIARGHGIRDGATGFFGGQTRAAVASFQRSQGWNGSGADGVPGKVTLARLGLR